MRILLLQKRFLFPPDTGGKIRTLNVLRHLAKWHEVTYLCNEQEADGPWRNEMVNLGLDLRTVPWKEAPRYSLPFYRDLMLNLVSKYPYNVNKDFDSQLRDQANKIIQNESIDLVICDFVQMARNVLGMSLPPSLLFEHNVEAQIFQRHSQTDKGLLRRAYMWLQWKKMAKFEGYAGRQFDRVIAVSQADKEMYKRDYDWNHVDVIDTSVDVDFFKPMSEPEIPNRMVFVGSMDWLPNIDGMTYFCNEIWPRIRKEVLDAEIYIVGRNPTADIMKLDSIQGVTVTGSVDDTRPYLANASLVIVPLRIGGGTRLKIPEAMAMKKTVLSTSLGAEGLPVENGRNIELADSPNEFADKAIELLQSNDQRERIGQSAFDLVNRRFSSEAVARQFEAICLDVISQSHDKRLAS